MGAQTEIALLRPTLARVESLKDQAKRAQAAIKA